jgi:A/G-specific adenine glycosylase
MENHIEKMLIERFFTRKVTRWAVSNPQEYPWRSQKTAYSVLLSEFLLQRTMAWQAIPVFTSIMQKYPNLLKLANCKLPTLKRIIRPIGLINRANRIKQVFQQIRDNFAGIVPDKFDKLIQIPGIGRYIANALLCFAYNQPVAIVDGNVIRIFRRFFLLTPLKKTLEHDEAIWALAKSLLPEKNYQVYNYGVLDLGINICRPKQPKCYECPLNPYCTHFTGQAPPPYIEDSDLE